MAETSSLNCRSCKIPYQSLHALNAWTPFSEKALFFTDFLLRRIPFPKLGSKRVGSGRKDRGRGCVNKLSIQKGQDIAEDL